MLTARPARFTPYCSATFCWMACVLGLLFFPLKHAHALEQNKKLWAGISLQRPLSNNGDWEYLLFSQIRLIDKSHPWQTLVLEGGLGYFLSPSESLWIGYYWSGHNPNNNFYQTNRLWQQLVLRSEAIPNYTLISRTRLEESSRNTDEQIAWRLRQRLTLLGPPTRIAALSPLIYEEAFFQLNRTSYTVGHDFSENRFFVGFNLRASPGASYEIGYINQYQFSRSGENQMNHILALTCNLT